jgi:hypothetical protein
MMLVLRGALVGTLATLLTSCSDGDGKYARAFVSPAGDYDAVLVTESGGGFGSTYCVNTVLVVPSSLLGSGIYPTEDRAYKGACHTLKMIRIDGRAMLPNAPQLRWTGAHELSIIYNPAYARQGVSATYTATSLHGGAITIRHLTQ